jgi:hypothetical protein
MQGQEDFKSLAAEHLSHGFLVLVFGIDRPPGWLIYVARDIRCGWHSESALRMISIIRP